MIDFEKELKKYEPETEIDRAEELIKKSDLADLMDLLRELGENKKK